MLLDVQSIQGSISDDGTKKTKAILGGINRKYPLAETYTDSINNIEALELKSIWPELSGDETHLGRIQNDINNVGGGIVLNDNTTIQGFSFPTKYSPAQCFAKNGA